MESACGMGGFLQTGRERNQGVKEEKLLNDEETHCGDIMSYCGDIQISNKWAASPRCLSTGVNEVSLKPATWQWQLQLPLREVPRLSHMVMVGGCFTVPGARAQNSIHHLLILFSYLGFTLFLSCMRFWRREWFKHTDFRLPAHCCSPYFTHSNSRQYSTRACIVLGDFFSCCHKDPSALSLRKMIRKLIELEKANPV